VTAVLQPPAIAARTSGPQHAAPAPLPAISSVPETGAGHPTSASTSTSTSTTAKRSGSGSAKSRNQFLDAARSIAVVRVVIWHTFATAIISWSVASMPAMFFVAGSLLARSVDTKPARVLYRDRFRRLLVPFWVYGGVVLSVFAFVHHRDGTANTAIPMTKLVAWFFPIFDPKASEWEAGWVTTPLWYLRCYLWLVLLSPLLRAVHRRLGTFVLVLPILGIFAVDFLIRHPDLAPGPFTSMKWYIGDLVTYSFFLMLGFCHYDGLVARLTTRDRLEWAGVMFAAAFLWVGMVDVPGKVVNNSYALLLFVGIGWLALFLAAEQWIGSLPSRAVAGPVIRWLGRRSMTVYLWHTVAIVFAYWVRASYAPGTPRVVVLPIVAGGVVLLAIAFGWVEDVSAGRRPEWWPGRSMPTHWVPASVTARSKQLTGVALGLAVGLVAIAFVLPGGADNASTASAATGEGGLALPPAPSAKPDEAVFDDTASTESEDGDGGGLALPPAPSAKPDEAVFDDTETSTTAAEASATSSTTDAPAEAAPLGASSPAGDVAARVEAAAEAWRVANDVEGVRVGVSFGDGTHTVVHTGTEAGGGELVDDAAFPVTSITKTMTSAIILQLVGEGKVALDDPLPALDRAPDFPFVGQVTIRQLLMHTSGIASYNAVPAFAAKAASALAPEDALALSATEPLQWEPGTSNGYSATGFITLGLLAEQLTGKDFSTLLDEMIEAKAGMTSTSLDDTPTGGWIGYSAGGVLSTVPDLLSWGSALYRDGKVLSPDLLAEMTNIENEFSAGLGAYPVCPCSLDANGHKVYASIGHHGGQATLQYSPTEDLVIAVYVTESFWTGDLSQSDIAKLLTEVRSAVAAG
jgi:CubicO group peptidase (beta-lactamase class C family)/peptidoglycan/LPS O-acetylase OafA/YrhL